MRRSISKFAIIASGASIGMLFGCVQSDSGKDPLPTQTVVATPSTSATDDSEDDESDSEVISTATTIAQLSDVINGLLPDSLAINNAQTLRLADDPCQGTDGFFDCQPNLIKLFLAITKQMAGLSESVLTEVAPALNAIPIGTSGTLEVTDGSGPTSIEYNIETANKFQVLFVFAAEPSLYLEVDDSVVLIKMDAGAFVDDEESDDAGMVEALISYKSNNEFDVSIKITEMSCDASDIRGPSKIAIEMNRKDSLWTGKTMLFHPRWQFTDQNPMTCDSVPTDDSSLAFYTDFVGDNSSTTAAIYLIPATIDTKAVSGFAASNFCDNFAELCVSGEAMGDTEPVSTYTNNFCIPADGAVTWGVACPSSNSAVSAGTFLDSAHWIIPSEFKNVDIELPASLD